MGPAEGAGWLATWGGCEMDVEVDYYCVGAFNGAIIVYFGGVM
jgi:hypothetical protein